MVKPTGVHSMHVYKGRPCSRFNFRWVIVKYRLLARLLYWVLRTVCGAGLLSEAALIEKWLGCSPIAGTSLSPYWSKSGCQLHRLDRCSELGLCRQSNRCRNHHSALLRLAYHLDNHRCRIALLPISNAEPRRPAVGLAGVGRMLEFFACIFSANPEILKESSPFDA
jgi:hypothetical protein